jgi:homoserine O-acetyltransferase
MKPVAPGPATAVLDDVESEGFTTRDFRLESGVTLPELTLAYETYGQLAPDGENVILATHGYTGSHHFAGRYRPGGAPRGLSDSDVGAWDKLVGPGKAVDTGRFFVVSSNMLGSSYGSTGPASLDPRTGKPYGPTFPRITVGDIVAAQRLLLESLGVRHLKAVIGPSYGGFQAFQWAVQYPERMRGIVAAVTSPRAPGGLDQAQGLLDQLSTDPNWNGGWYYDRGGIPTVMTRIRVATLKRYGIEAQLAEKFPDPVAREREIVKAAEPWVRVFDGHSMVVLRRALDGFDTAPRFDRIRARVLYVLARTDNLFPPSIGPGVMQALRAAGVDARYFEIDTELGHLASGLDGDKWAPVLGAFLDELGGG